MTPELRPVDSGPAQQKMQAEQARQVITFINTGLKVLGTRGLAYLTALIAAGLYAWVCYEPDWIRFASATAYMALGFLNVVRKFD